ncbi:hypothetical protein FRC07_004236, partial [Ceratobasidium sp. 392]
MSCAESSTAVYQLDMIVLLSDFMPPPGLSLTALLTAFGEDVDEPAAAALLYERPGLSNGKDNSQHDCSTLA